MSKARINVCFVTYVLQGYDNAMASGIGRYVSDLAMGIIEKHDPMVAVTAHRDSAGDDRYPFPIETISPVSTKLPHQIAFILNARRTHTAMERITRQYEIDILDAPITRGLLGTYVSEKKVPLVTRLVTGVAQGLYTKDKGWLHRRISNMVWKPVFNLERQMVRQADCVVTPSVAEAESVNRLYPFDTPLEVIPFSVPDLTQQIPQNQARGKLRIHAPDPPLLLFIGVLYHRKGVDTLIEAHKILQQRGNDYTIALLGLDRWPGGFQRYLNEQGADEDGSVVLLGQLSDQQKHLWIAAADVCVFPSRWESFGLVVIEAMRQSRPVICSNAGGMGEIAADNAGVIAVPPAAPGTLAEAMEHVLSMSEAQRTAMGRAGRRVYEERYTPEVVLPQNIALYESLL